MALITVNEKISYVYIRDLQAGDTFNVPGGLGSVCMIVDMDGRRTHVCLDTGHAASFEEHINMLDTEVRRCRSANLTVTY